MWSKLSNSLWGNIDLTDFESGGIECKASMSFLFKFTISVIMIPLYFFIIFKISKFQTSPTNLKSKWFEKLFGIAGIIIYFYTCFLKHRSKAMMFMLNPCHTIGLIQSICLLLDSNDASTKMARACNNLLFCGISALITPNLKGLNSEEIFFFFYEHYEMFIINPSILYLGGRYFDSKCFGIMQIILAHAYFGLYQRILLFPLSELTLVNLNYTLCHSIGDPFIKYIGNWYYSLSDVYLCFISIIITYVQFCVFWILRSCTGQPKYLKSE